jgi:hypothetical protein
LVTHTHTYIHTYLHTHIHTYIHTYFVLVARLDSLITCIYCAVHRLEDTAVYWYSGHSGYNVCCLLYITLFAIDEDAVISIYGLSVCVGGAGIAQSVWRLATGWTVRGLDPGGGRDFPRGSLPASCTLGTRFVYWGYSSRGLALTSHRHLSSRLKEE